jgi:hypothetical protein
MTPPLLAAALATGSCSALIGADFGDYQAGEGGSDVASASSSSSSSAGGATSASAAASQASGGGDGGNGGAGGTGGSDGVGGEAGGVPTCGPPPSVVEITKTLAIDGFQGEVHLGAMVATGDPDVSLEIVGTYIGNILTESEVMLPPASDDHWTAFRAAANGDDLEFVSAAALGTSPELLRLHGAAHTVGALLAGGVFTGSFTAEESQAAVAGDGPRARVVRDGDEVATLPDEAGDGAGESLVAAMAAGPSDGEVAIVGATEEAEPQLGLAVGEAPSSSAFFLTVLRDGIVGPAALVSPPDGPSIACSLDPEELNDGFVRRANDVDVAVLDRDRIVVAGTTCGAIRSPSLAASPSEAFIAPYRQDAQGTPQAEEGLHLGDGGPDLHAIRAVAGAGGRVLVGGVADGDLAVPPLDLRGVERAGFVAEATLDGPGAPRWARAQTLSEIGLEDVNDLVLADGRIFVAGPTDGQTGSVIAELDGELEVVWSKDIAGVSVQELVLVDCVLFAAASSGTPPSTITILRLPL